MIPSIELAQEQARRLAIVDEFGELERQIAEFKPKTERHKALKEQILSWYADLDGAATAQAEGRRYSVQIGTRQNQRTITKPWKAWALLRRAIGLDQVMELVTIPLAAIDRYIPAEQHAWILSEARTGARKVVAVAMASEVVAQAA